MKIKTFIINLNNRHDRLKHILSETKKVNLKYIEHFTGIVPTINDILTNPIIDISKFYKFKSLSDFNSIKYCIGASGCKLSHLNILKNIKKEINLENNIFDYFLIIEDDCVFDIENPSHLFNSIEKSINSLKDENIDFNILYLACKFNNKTDFSVISDSLLKCNKYYGYTTHSYIVNPKNIDKIINHIENSVTEIDNTYTTLNERYVIYPMLTYQLKNESDILSHITGNSEKEYNHGLFHKIF